MRDAGKRIGVGFVAGDIISTERTSIREVIVVVSGPEPEGHKSVPILRAGDVGESDGGLMIDGDSGRFFRFDSEQEFLSPNGGTIAPLQERKAGSQQFLQASSV